MINLKLNKIQHEVETWRCLLLYMQEENIHLKNQLSEVLKDRFDKKMLQELEVFQTKFIMKNNLITSLEKEVAVIEEYIHSKKNLSIEIIDPSEKNIAGIRNNLEIAEKIFSFLNSDLNHYLSESIKEQSKQ